MSSSGAELEAALDRLYQAPLGGFTDARNALAAERKAAGDKHGALLVKALAKPTAVAWVVNQVYWKHRELFDGLVAAIAEVAAAQREALRGEGAAELRDATRRRADSLQQALRVCERRLLDSGAQAGAPVLQRVAATLEAVASPRPPGAATPRAGRLEVELRPAGFEAALGLGALDLPPVPPRPAPEPTASGGPRVPSADDAARAARQAVQQAELELARLRRELDMAARGLAEAESRAAAARADVMQLEARLQQVRARAAEKSEVESAARRALEESRAAVAAAEAALAALERSDP